MQLNDVQMAEVIRRLTKQMGLKCPEIEPKQREFNFMQIIVNRNTVNTISRAFWT